MYLAGHAQAFRKKNNNTYAKDPCTPARQRSPGCAGLGGDGALDAVRALRPLVDHLWGEESCRSSKGDTGGPKPKGSAL